MPVYWIDRLNGSLGRLPIGGGRLELIHWAYSDALPDNQPHRHTYFEACLVGGRGAGTFTSHGVQHPLRPGSFFLARPGVVHQIRNAPGSAMELYWVCFGWSPEESVPKGEGDRLLRALVESDAEVTIDDGRLIALWTALRAVAPAAVPDQIRSLVGALVIAMAQALVPESEAADQGSVEHQVARQAVRYIQDNLNRPLSLDEIAAHVHVSPRHLTRLFAAFTGTSPARYVALARLDRANALLVRTAAPIKEIAEATGFADVHHFTRSFGRRFGVSPAAHRRGEAHVRNEQTPGGLC